MVVTAPAQETDGVVGRLIAPRQLDQVLLQTVMTAAGGFGEGADWQALAAHILSRQPA